MPIPRQNYRACVIGWPINHSRSPLIHNHWFSELGVNGHYDIRAIPPESDFKAALLALKDEGYIGANVTIPHKQAAFNSADEVDHRAARLGVVNTIYLAPDRIIGRNTDGEGFLASYEEGLGRAPDYGNMSALVLGAGGASRAIIGALLDTGIGEIRLTNRTRDRAEDLGRMAANTQTRLEIVDWVARDDALDGAALLVNTTSLGMTGQAPLDISLDRMTAGAVLDIVYTPLETPLLADARAAGLTAIDGLGMLLHQAVPAFELWTARRPRVTSELRQHLVDDLNSEKET